MNKILDLTKQAPRSPRVRIGDYVVMARTLDKCRADLNGKIGEYNYDCPLDNVLFSFKGIKGDALKEKVKQGASDEDILQWVADHGIPKTHAEVVEWSKSTEAFLPFNDPEEKKWFVRVCGDYGLNPETTTLFDFLDVDDKKSFSA